MNNSKKKPTFSSASSSNKIFKERHLEQRSYSDKTNKKVSKKAPHFNTQSNQVIEAKVTETVLGNVKVVTKSTGITQQTKVKKTGALSPRAPEKIKKNRTEEMKVFGENACLALFAQRPESIVRVWATVEMSHKIGEILSYLAAHKKVYHIVDQAELTLVSGTDHHNGICMLVKKTRPYTLTGYLDIPRQQDALVFIDNISNAHNLGGVIRTCAIFGVKSVVVEQSFSEQLNSAAAMRVAEGGMEYIRILETNCSEDGLQQLRQAGYQIVHISADKQGTALAKVRFKNKVVFVLTESNSQHLSKNGDENVLISAVNPLKAQLNIAVATGILLAKWNNAL